MRATSVLVRLGGLVAMVCGVLYAAQGIVVWLSEPPFSLGIPYLDSAGDLTWQTVVNVSDVVFLTGALVTVTTLPALQRESYGMTVTLVSLVTFLGLALLVVLGLGDVFQWFRSWTSKPLTRGFTLAT